MSEKIPRVTNIEIYKSYKIIVLFENGIKKEYDLRKLIKENKNFSQLKDQLLFSTAKVDPGGYGISWNDEIDLSEYELWKNGKKVD